MKAHFNKITTALFIALSISSCKKDELPVPMPDVSGVTTVTTGSTYDRQVYFNLSTGKEVATSHRADWDLGFSCSETPYIITNTSKMMTAMRIENLSFEQLTSIGNFNTQKKLDHNTGRIDSMAIRGGTLFLIDRGSGIDVEKGFIKLEIIEHTKDVFKGRLANLDGSNEQTVSISKDNNYNFVFLKWNKSGEITTPTVEPAKTEWDIVFTQYGYIFYEPAMLYSVMGCLINTHNTQALLIQEDKKYEDVDLAYVQTLELSTDKDVIGYNWKTVHGINSTPGWTIKTDNTYIIKDQHDMYYKLRFTGFMDPLTGEKGTPNFEYRLLI